MDQTANSPARHPTRRGFGVGCFHFRPNKVGLDRFELKDYTNDVRSALQRVTAINNVEIEFDDEYPSNDIPVGSVPSIEDGSGVFPNPVHLEIRFDVYIPFRIQAELSRKGIERETSTEHFRVLIQYTFHGPVAFVESVGAKGNYRPSAAVQVVREYLRREVNAPSSPVVFECLGPSPFHAEFYLSPVVNVPESLRGDIYLVEHMRTRGYSDILFSYDSSVMRDNEEALRGLYYELRDELGLFYDIKLSDLEALRTWHQFQEAVLGLTETPEKPTLLTRLGAAWRRGREIHQLHTALVRFEVHQLNEKHRLEHHHRGTYSSDEAEYLKAYLDDEMTDRPVFPTQQIGQLIQFLEERRSRAIELIIVLIAAIVGAVAGSLLTLVARG